MKKLLSFFVLLCALTALPLIQPSDVQAGLKSLGGIVQSNVAITGGTINGNAVTSMLSAGNQQQTLFILRNADMTLTTDQAFTKQGTFTNYIVTNIFAVRKTGAFGVTCAGGIYSGASKAGDAILAVGQSWAALTGAGTSAPATLSNLLQTKVETATPNLSLTTGNTGALTADIFILGTVVD